MTMDDVKRRELFESAPIKRTVIRQILPAVAGQMIALIYNLADAYFVGLLNNPNETAAITVAAAPFLMLTAVSNLFGIGGAGAISRALGRKDVERAKSVSGMVFWLGLFSGIVFSLLFFAVERPLLRLIGATDSTLETTYNYAFFTVVLGGPFVILNNLLANSVRAEGSAQAAAIGTSLGGALNILLDPFFVLPQFLGLGAAGAGMATAISNFIAAAYFFILIPLRENGVSNLKISGLKGIKRDLPEVLKSGFPSALQYALTVVAIAAQAKFASKYGETAVAALGIVKKLDQLPLYFSIGVSTGILPILAYNHGSGNSERLKKAFVFGTALSFAFSVFCLVIYEIFAPELSSIFIKDEETIRYAAGFLRRMVTAMPLMAICYPLIIRFQATGMVKESIICSLLRKGLLDIPLLFLMDFLLPLYGLMWVQPIVDGISLVASVSLLALALKKAKNRANS